MEKKSMPSRGSSSKSSSRQLSESFKSKEFVSSDESSSGENKSKKKRRQSEVWQEFGGCGAWKGEGHLNWYGGWQQMFLGQGLWLVHSSKGMEWIGGILGF